MFRKLLLSSVALGAMTAIAAAADLPSMKEAPAYVPPPPVFSWTGLYLGAQVGGVWDNNHFNDSIDPNAPIPPLDFNTDGGGIIAGGHIGYNYQINQFVLGVEGSFSYSGVDHTDYVPGGGGDATLKTRQNWLGSIGARVGYAFDRILIYADGGAAFTQESVSDYAYSEFNAHYSGGSRVGWTAGAGIEYALTNNWIIGVDYKYYDFGAHDIRSGYPYDEANLAGPGLDFFGFHQTENSVTARISYKFDLFAPPAPVVAKY